MWRAEMGTMQFVVDEEGRKKAVLVDARKFEKLQARLEDLEDALALAYAKEHATGFKVYEDFVAELRREGRL